jgi:hypothetical protein
VIVRPPRADPPPTGALARKLRISPDRPVASAALALRARADRGRSRAQSRSRERKERDDMKSRWKQGRNDTRDLRVTLWSSPSGAHREGECAMITGGRNPNKMA